MLLVTLMMFLGGASSCGTRGITWDPNFYKTNSVKEAIIDRNNIHVYCNEPKFDDYACLSKEKIKELKEILIKARIPKEELVPILKILDGAIKE